ncbi:MAG: ATP-binding protein [Polyangiales bacterium]
MSALRPSLLIIDDNRDLAENLADIFEPRGFAVRHTPSAREGLESARAHGFDLALVDVNLPDTRGTELLPALRAASPAGEVVVITGHATLDSAVAAVRGGAFHYVVKPFKVDDLVATAEGALRQAAIRNERARLAKMLETSERRYRGVVESTQVLVIGLDGRGVVRLFNRRASDVTGWAAEEILGEAALEHLLPPEARERVGAQVRSVLAGRRAAPEFEAPLLTRDGRTRTILWHVVPSGDGPHDPTVEPLALYAVGTDVTERRTLERKAAEAEALAHMGTLAAGLAHEIRNPLNAALLQLHLLGRGVDKLPPLDRANLPERVQIVASELRRLERLLSDFLELARPRPMAREPVDLHALLEEVLSFQEPAAAERGVTLVRRLGEARVVGDRERMKQVFHNLIVNAIEATAKGGAVTVAAHLDPGGEEASATVSDNGRGIPRGALEKVFEPFFTTKEAGTGLGLAIVRQIVERHGGRVELDSVENHGTQVTVYIPAWHGRG